MILSLIFTIAAALLMCAGLADLGEALDATFLESHNEQGREQ